MPRWESEAITVGDFVKLTVRDVKKGIYSLLSGSASHSPKGTVQVEDLYGNRYRIDLQLCRLGNGVRLDYKVIYLQTGRETQGSIEFVRKACNFGGERFYFICPMTRELSYTLRLFRGHFVSRHYLGKVFCANGVMLYHSQTTSGLDRDRQRVRLAEKRLERRGVLEDENGFWVKPKWMRYATFERLVDRANRETERQMAGLCMRFDSMRRHIKTA